MQQFVRDINAFVQQMTSFEVIGAGMGRTGTMTMKLALEELGFAPCHHMLSIFAHPEKYHHLETLSNNLDDEGALVGLFGGYKAVVDHPGCVFYEKFMKIHPNAKVILTIRDSPDAWQKSAQDTIFELNKPMNWVKRQILMLARPAHIKVMERLCTEMHGHNPFDPETDLTQIYKDWYARVTETVPSERLLIFNVKEGWRPLCEFLGVPIPEKDFPKVNSTKEFQKMKKSMIGKQLKNNFGFSLIAVCVFLVFYFLISEL